MPHEFDSEFMTAAHAKLASFNSKFEQEFERAYLKGDSRRLAALLEEGEEILLHTPTYG